MNPSSQYSVYETPFVEINHIHESEFNKSSIQENEISPFLGLFEGKKSSSSSSDSNSGSSSSASSGGGGAGLLNVLGSIFAGGLGLATTVAPILPQLGLGSKSRQKEMQAQADAQIKIVNAQALSEKANDERDKQMYIIAGVFLVVIVVVMTALRR